MTTPSNPGTEWVSFVDDQGETWLFDLSFFRSNWRCIYGEGCAGIKETPDTERHHGCCSYGAHFVDDADLVRVMGIAAALPASLWQHHHDDANVDSLTAIDDEGERITRLVDDACIFLNRPGFDSGVGCALHLAALRAELDPLEWKPEVCWQLPLRVEHHLDDNNHATHMVRQWARRDWGESGVDLGWWCAEAPEAYSGSKSVAQYLRAEITAIAGQTIAQTLIDHVDGTGTLVSLPLPSKQLGP